MKKKTLSAAIFAVLLVPAVLIVSEEIERLKVVFQHRSVKSVAPRLMEELTSGGQISLDTRRNTLTVLDEAAVVARIGKMASELDVPARHFAVSATLSVFASKPRSVFREDERLTDISDFMDKSRAAEKYDGVLDLYEGKSGNKTFGQSYQVSVTLGGYDPWERKLGFENITLEKKTEKGRALLFKGNASLAEGSETSIVIPSRDELPAVSLSMNPTLLPSIEKSREIP